MHVYFSTSVYVCVHREGGMEGDIHVIALSCCKKKCMSSIQSHDKGKLEAEGQSNEGRSS